MILGIDYGRSFLGVAISAGELADPLTIVDNKHPVVALHKLHSLVKEHQINLLVVGIASGAMAKESHRWGLAVSSKLGISVKFVDEALSSVEANKDHAKAAAIILRRFLEEETIKGGEKNA